MILIQIKIYTTKKSRRKSQSKKEKNNLQKRKQILPINKNSPQIRGSHFGSSIESGASQEVPINDAVNNSVSQPEGSINPPTIGDVTNIESQEIVIAEGRPEKPLYTKAYKKKIVNRPEWFIYKNQHARNSGQAYQYKVKCDPETVINVPAKKVGSPCTCKMRCFDKLGQETITKIFKEYWELANYDLQNANLQSKMKKHDIKPKRRGAPEPKRSGSFSYFLKKSGVEDPIRVCKAAFISMHGISKHKVLYAWKKSLM